jgi:MORN repeat variant
MRCVCLVLLMLVSGCPKKGPCPDNGELVGAHPPAGNAEWCQRQDVAGNWVKHGPSREWWTNGQLKSEETYIDGEPDGLRREWAEDGTIVGEATFTRGSLTGGSTSWHRGVIQQKCTPADASGRYQCELFDDGGSRLASTAWLAKKQTGPYRAFCRDGKVSEEGEYLDGQKHGLWRTYHITWDGGDPKECACLQSEGRYEHGIETGEWLFSAPPVDQERLKEKEALCKRFGRQKGELMLLCPTEDELNSCKTYKVVYATDPSTGVQVATFENGKKRSEGSVRGGKRTGEWTYWYKSGRVDQTGFYRDGEKDGPWLVYIDAPNAASRIWNFDKGRMIFD